MSTAVFLDRDFTYWRWGVVPESAERAIRVAQANGHVVLANTGRTRAELEDMGPYGLDGVCCATGTDIVLHGEQVLLAPLGEQASRLVWESLAASRRGVVVAEGREQCFAHSFDDVVRARMLRVSRGAMLSAAKGPDILSMGPEDFAQVHKYAVILPEGPPVFELLPQDLPDGYVATPLHSAFEVTDARHTKATAMEAVRAFLGGDWRTVAFGDAGNDIPMLEAADVGVAMGNGTDAAKAAADFVTDAIDEDGLLHAFERLGLV